MRRIILESPFAGDIDRNLHYARACLRDSLLRGESPIASHLLYTQPGVLDDSIPEERELGIRAGLEWTTSAHSVAFYLDHGWSPGMQKALNWHRGFHREVEYRYLYAQQEELHANTKRPGRCEDNDSLGLREPS